MFVFYYLFSFILLKFDSFSNPNNNIKRVIMDKYQDLSFIFFILKLKIQPLNKVCTANQIL